MSRLHVIPLEDRMAFNTTPESLIAPAGEFNWLQAAPDGSLYSLVFKGGDLTARVRVNGGWVDEPVIDPDRVGRGGAFVFRQSIGEDAQQAQLLITPDSVPHAFYASTDSVGGDRFIVLEHYSRSPGGEWTLKEMIPVGAPADFFNEDSFESVTGAVAADGSMHLVLEVYDGTNDRSTLRYLTDQSGAWVYEDIPAPLEIGRPRIFGLHVLPRYVSIDVDSANAVHIAYTPRFESENLGRVYSQLNYVTNRGGSWTVETVFVPPDGTGDAGLASSLAVGPDDQPRIASYYVDRVGTGSPASAQLLFHQKIGANWTAGLVASQADGYVAADGAQYTGFSPLLQFDGSTPVITFSDVAAQHITGFANEYTGQIRTATFVGGAWQLNTVFRQSAPLANALFLPVRTVVNGTPVYAALVGSYELDPNGLLYDDSGVYTLVELNAPIIPPKGPEPGTPGGKLGAGVVGADRGGGPTVQVYDKTGARTQQFFAFEPSFTGGVRVASADFNGDGVADAVAGTGPGIATRVRVFDGKTGAELFAVTPFEVGFTGGVYVATGDVTGDGVPDLAITPDEGGGPRVDVYSGVGFAKVASFFGIDDTNFRGGARAAVGDLNNDGRDDLVVVAGFGGGPRVAGFDGRTVSANSPTRLFGDFFAFEQSLRNGVFVAVGDLNGDGFAELIAGGGPGGGPRVTAFDGAKLLANEYVPRANFFAGDSANRGGVRLAISDVDGDGQGDIVAGSGTGAGSRVSAYKAVDLMGGSTSAFREFDAFLGFTGGVFVG
ncbi:MAG: VCBS repeat-containing protein [Planctomycetia bacterium]|nr:VCBS repeat-containing protein [Planctomycetia bacterium]